MEIEFLKADGSKERRNWGLSPCTVWDAYRKLKDTFQLKVGESTLYTMWQERGYKPPVKITAAIPLLSGNVPDHVDWHVFIKRVK